MHEKLQSTVEVWHPCLGMLQPPPQVRGGECPTRAGRQQLHSCNQKASPGLEQWATPTSDCTVQKRPSWQRTSCLFYQTGVAFVLGASIFTAGSAWHAQLSRTLPANPEVIHKTQKECKKARWKGEAWGGLESDPDFACAHPHPNHSQTQQQRTEAQLAPGAWAKPLSGPNNQKAEIVILYP